MAPFKVVKLVASIVACIRVTIACDVGRFGQDCYFDCHCADGGPCDSETGACPGNVCATGWFGPGCQIGDVANGKTARLSTLRDGNPNNTLDGRNRTVIPSLESLQYDCAGTSYERRSGARYPSRWWQVDLRSEHVVYEVVVSQFRIESSPARATSLDPIVIVRVQDVSIDRRTVVVEERNVTLWNGTRADVVDETICSKVQVPRDDGNGNYRIFTCRKPLRGRYVTIEVVGHRNSMERFDLCEVDVTGYESCPFDGGRGPGCLNDCLCQDRSECGRVAGVCESGCRGPYYGQTCFGKWPTPRLTMRAVANEGEYDRVSFSVDIKRIFRVQNSLDYAITRTIMEWKPENESVWEMYSLDIYASQSKYRSRDVAANRSVEFRLRVLKIPVGLRLENGTSMVVSNVVTKCRRPGSVRDVRTTTGPTASTLTWEVPDEESDCPISGYELDYDRIYDKSCDRSTIELTTTARAKSSDYVLKRLSPYSTYRVRIRTVVEGSLGTVAETTFETLSGSPALGVRPETPAYRHLTSRSVEITFDRFPCEYANGPFQYYAFRLEDLTSSSGAPRIVSVSDATQRSLLLAHINPRVNYSVSVTFHNDVESSSPSAERRFLTASERPEPPTMTLWGRLPNGTVPIWVNLPSPPQARLVEVVVECRTESWNLEGTITNVTKRRNVERESPSRVDFNDFVVNERERIICKTRVHSDEGASQWSNLYAN